MQAKKINERRFDKRFQVSGKLNARLLRSSSKEDLTFLIVDVSKNGFGLVVDEPISAKETLMFEITTGKKVKVFNVEVRWTQINQSDELESLFGTSETSVYRCGIKIIESATNLEDLLRQTDGIVLEELY